MGKANAFPIFKVRHKEPVCAFDNKNWFKPFLFQFVKAVDLG